MKRAKVLRWNYWNIIIQPLFEYKVSLLSFYSCWKYLQIKILHAISSCTCLWFIVTLSRGIAVDIYIKKAILSISELFKSLFSFSVGSI